MSRTLKEVQEDFAKMSGYQKEVIWDLLSEDQGHILKQKIKNLIPDQSRSPKPIQRRRLRETLFESVWAQRKYTNRNLLSSIFYVLVSKETDLANALVSPEFSCHPVFRTRKCVDNNNSSECCMVYIDETGRVYKNWAAYLTENVLPKGAMVAPQRGVYTFDESGAVNLELHPTPASGFTSTALGLADTSAGVSGLLAAGVSIASLCAVPVAAPLLAAAGGVGIVSAAYSAVRSGSNLIDRSSHEQSISLAHSEARGSWLGVLGGAVGLGACSATRAVTSAAAAGRQVSTITTIVVNGMNISSIVLSGGGVAHGVFDIILKYRDDEQVGVMDVMQLAASLVLFTHSVSNFRLASSIVNEAQNNRIQSYREGLSNRQRKIFDKMTKETVRIRGSGRGRIDVIRGVNEMSSKQYLNDLHKINRQLNKQNVRPSFGGGSDGHVLLNNEVSVDTNVLRNSVQRNIGPDVLSQVNQPIPATYTHGEQAINGRGNNVLREMQQRLVLGETSNSKDSCAGRESGPSNEATNDNATRTLMAKTVTLSGGAVMCFAELGPSICKYVVNVGSLESIVKEMSSDLVEESFRCAIKIAQDFIENFLKEIEESLNIKIPREDVLRKLHDIIKSYKNRCKEYLSAKAVELIIKLRHYFRSSEYQDRNAFYNKISNKDNFDDIINGMAKAFPEDIFELLINIAKEFATTELPNIERTLGIPIYTEDVLQRILACCESYEELSYETLNERSLQIRSALKEYFLRRNPRNDRYPPKRCETCRGYFVVCDL